MRTALLALVVLAWLAPGTAGAQTPAGAIAGVVRDPSGSVIQGASVVVTNKDKGMVRPVTTTATGDYTVPALPPGTYEVVVEATGFARLVKQVLVEAGNTTTVDMPLAADEIRDTAIVTGAATPQIRYDSPAIGGVVPRLLIDSLPSNGRGMLDWSRLEPGAQQPVRTSNNRTLVPMLGAPAGQSGRATRVTVDSGSIMQIGNGGSAMGFSQEVVQEFQISTVNLDLSTGITASGAVNVVTRSGTNQWAGSGFLYFRDHTLSAYPALQRDPFNPDPFFQRSQFGVTAGGPIHKDRAFFFGSWEQSAQQSVTPQLLTGDFAPLSGIFPSPTHVNQFSGRADVRLTDKHWMFLRHSQENITSFGTTTLPMTGGARALPSAWRSQPGQTSQSLLGLTSQLRPNLVNELGLSYFFVDTAEESPTAANCAGCFGLGAPSITVNPDLFIGSSITTRVLGRRYHLNDVAAWQKGSHHIQFGGDVEISSGGRTDLVGEPVTMTLFSPDEVRTFNALPSTPAARRIPLPDSFLTVPEILQLPVRSFSVGIGDPRVPQSDLGLARLAPVVHVFVEDAWRLRPRLTVNYGLGWTYDAPFNYDLAKPAYLTQVLGENGLGPTRKNWNNFSPSAGFAWNLREDGKTVIRGGAGKYYDFGVPFSTADPERVSLGPHGVGRGTYLNTAITNPLSGIPGVAFGTLLTFRSPTLFTGDTLLQALPAIRANLTALRNDPNNREFTNIEVDKTGSVVASDLPSVSAIHASLGVQRQLAAGLVVSADLVVRQYSHLGMQVDLNHFSKPGGQVLPTCTTPAQRSDPTALCSLGIINVFSAIGRARYQGLLLRVDKRFADRWQFLGSYAYASNVGTNTGPGFNNDDPLANYGPLDRDVRHVLSLSGLVDLPRQFHVAAVVTYSSTPPLSASFSLLDLNGDGKKGDLLPGTTVNQFNRSLGKDDLVRLVKDFNSKYAGTTDALGTPITAVALPDQFELGNRFLTADLRLTWILPFHDRWRLTLIGEVFNLLNTVNLAAPSGDLSFPATFGQPGLLGQVFGSGGPRSFQLAARLSF